MRKKIRVFFLLNLLINLSGCANAQGRNGKTSNPIMPGYFADPTIVKNKDTYFIYATIDPWGGDELGVFETKDFMTFKRHHLNWPTKALCTSPSSNKHKVWAPSVVKGTDNNFYMYVSVGSEVWAGVSANPLGPWKNIKEDNSPLIKFTDFSNMHNIDADCFIDDNGQAYLYWGSGWNWVNGHCMAVRLKKDMKTFDGTPVDVTTPHYFEAPHMIKRNGKYYLMFSEGKAIDATYQIGYATSNSPLGPFIEPEQRIILKTTSSGSVVGPGHHTVFTEKNQDYILYHKIFPQKKDYVLRQLCLDSLNFDVAGNIKTVNTKGIKL